MQNNDSENQLATVWQTPGTDWQNSRELCYFSGVGVGIGLIIGIIIALFRISTDYAYTYLVTWAASRHTFWQDIIWIVLANAAALVVIFLIRNPDIRLSGHLWIHKALAYGQLHAWARILFPKFLGSWLVMACGVSVGREGPCIQMGAATALGLKHFDQAQRIERRYFILAGCACGLAAAFSAPLAGICYVYEVMKQKFDRHLLFFLLAGGFGVYLGCTQICGLDVMLPLGATPMPNLDQLWLLIPLGLAAGICGIAYNYGLRGSIWAYKRQKLVARQYWPILVFGVTALIVLYCTAISGEGLTIFQSVQNGHATLSFLAFFLIAKLIYTAFCFGSGIPAGVMVPVLCIGGVAGGICAECFQTYGLLGAEYATSCIVMGMAAAFAAAERAPLTAFVLVAEMTGSFSAGLGLLAVAAIGAFMAQLAKVRPV